MANRLMLERLLVERTERRGWNQNHPMYRQRRRLEGHAKRFDASLTAVQHSIRCYSSELYIPGNIDLLL